MKYFVAATLAAVAHADTDCASNADCAVEGAGYSCVQNTDYKKRNKGAAYCDVAGTKCGNDDGNKSKSKRIYWTCPFTDRNPADPCGANAECKGNERCTSLDHSTGIAKVCEYS